MNYHPLLAYSFISVIGVRFSTVFGVPEEPFHRWNLWLFTFTTLWGWYFDKILLNDHVFQYRQ
jgi:hypothetical protein